jgi:hypothetical protein
MIEAYEQRHGIEIVHAWGMTELSPLGTIGRLKSYQLDLPEAARFAIRAKQGRPVPGIEVRAIDLDGAEVPWDGQTIGELQVRGPWVIRDYYRDERSGEGFSADGWFRTGDVVTIDPEGYVLIVDRTKDLIKSGGESQPVVFGAPGADPYEDALLFHQTLLAAAPEQLGVAPDARYAFYAFVGLSPHADATAPWFPHEPLQAELCDTAASPGLGYQALSVITDPLRYPVCEGRGFDAVLRVLARSVVESAKAECSFQLPAPPRGQFLNKDTIHVEYRPRGDGEAVDIRQVAEEGRCDDHAFLLRGDRIELCRQACAIVEADRAAALRVLYGCLVDVE